MAISSKSRNNKTLIDSCVVVVETAIKHYYVAPGGIENLVAAKYRTIGSS